MSALERQNPAHEAEIVPLHRPDLPDRVETGGQYVVGRVCDIAQAANVKIPPAHLAMIGGQAKQLMDAGFAADRVIAACWISLQRGKPHIVQYVAGDLELAAAGIRMSRVEYESKLATFAQDQNQRPNLLADQRARLEQRRAEIDQRRAQ